MAILDQILGLKVEIVDLRYRPLTEYIDDKSDRVIGVEEDPRQYEAATYGEVKSGSMLGVRVTFDDRFETEYNFHMEVKIDD